MGMLVSPYGNAPAVIPLSSPLDITGCSLWYDVQDITTLDQLQAGGSPVTTVGQSIGRITDKSGNSRTIGQGTSSARPTYSANGAYRNAYFNGFNQCLQNALTNVPVSTVFALVRVEVGSSDANSSMLSNLTDQASGVDFVWTRSGSSNAWDTTQATGGGLAASTRFWVNRTQTANWNAGAESVYAVDGTGHASRVLPTGTNIGLDRNLAGRYIEMYLYEMFAYDTILSAGDRARAEQYLGNRYGITLP